MVENYECPDCGARIEDRGDGTALVTVRAVTYSTVDCETCKKHNDEELAKLAKQMAQRRFEKYKEFLESKSDE